MIKVVVLFALFAYASSAPQRIQSQAGPAPQQFQGNYQQGPPPREYADQPQGHPQGPPRGHQHPAGPGRHGPPPQPKINWGKCTQLEPTMQDRIKKSTVINQCLEVTPIPENITRETVELHREQVAACALQVEGWFNDQGTYRFEKAENEIKLKKLPADVEKAVLEYHQQCKQEAMDKFPVKSKRIIPQIQLYQACMDYFISEVCGIEVTIPGQQGPPPQNPQGPPPQNQQGPPPQYQQGPPPQYQQGPPPQYQQGPPPQYQQGPPPQYQQGAPQQGAGQANPQYQGTVPDQYKQQQPPTRYQ